MKSMDREENIGLVYRLKGLGMAGAVLHIGAHPDDEDIGLLSYLSCKYGVRAVYWSATRGEGGQNRIGPYREEALGIYRTWESLAARAEDRSECLFGPFYDFGYSKNAEETFAKWGGRETLIREMVRAIRLVQPHIVVCRWTGGPEDIHGQHQAVGMAALKAFEISGDPEQFQDLKEQGLPPWQAMKYYHSMDNSGGDLTAGGAGNLSGRANPALEKARVVCINTGEFDPAAGKTYQERAWTAYNKHQTQAMGLAPAPGDFFYYFFLKRTLTAVPERETDLFDGLDPTLTSLADYPGNDSPSLRKRLEEIKRISSEALWQFRADDPMEGSASLLDGLSLLRDTRRYLPETELSEIGKAALARYLNRRIRDFEEVAAWCLGFKLECLSDRLRLIPGQRLRAEARFWNHRGIPIQQIHFKLDLPAGWICRPLSEMDSESEPPGLEPLCRRPMASAFEIQVPETAKLSCPYWLVEPRDAYVYRWPNGEPGGRPFGQPQARITCRIDMGPHHITLTNAIVCKEPFPGGFRELPLTTIPPISLHPKSQRQFRMVSDSEQKLDLQVVARNNSDGEVAGTLEIEVPQGWRIFRNHTGISLAYPGDTLAVQHRVTVPAGAPAGVYPIAYRVRCGNREYSVVVSPVRMGIPGLPNLPDRSNCIREEFMLQPAQATVHLLDVRLVQGLTYGYVQGAGEDLMETLKSLGVIIKNISDEEMAHIDLSAFDAVIIGPNAYLIRDELRNCASRFLEYVNQGGTLIVQYQGYSYQDGGFAPYPFQYHMPHDRVTHEDAPVKILEPDDLLFRLPNTIGSKDFDGWIRERGLYFFGQWDSHYRPLLASFDPGEEPKLGGLMVCEYGRGSFVYVAYSFFRQLPAGVPGAFRLFANMLALPEATILERIEFLRKVSLFSCLTEVQLDAIARIMSERWEPDGHYICRQGQTGHEAYIVYRGAVEVVLEKKDREEIVYVARQGDCLGEMAIMGNMPRTASLRTRGSIRLLVIHGDDFLSLLRQYPDMSIELMKILAGRLSAFLAMARK